jgi:alkylresorcinol/alkylpyrone synthase
MEMLNESSVTSPALSGNSCPGETLDPQGTPRVRRAAWRSANQPVIRGLGVANPPHLMTQEQSLEMFIDIVCSDERQSRLARALYKKSGVDQRYTCVPHQVAYGWCQGDGGHGQASEKRLHELLIPPVRLPQVDAGKSAGPTTHERMAMYRMFAPHLAERAAIQALQAASTAAREITHLVTVSCTGFAAPGVELELIERLQLPRGTQRINVGFMGCHGAINGLRAAQGVAAVDPDAKVLMVAVELCSLHYRFQWDNEGIVGNALFADGAAALVLSRSANEVGVAAMSGQAAMSGGGEIGGDGQSWHLCGTGSFVIPESQGAMSWHVGNHGFEMLLTAEVGDRIEAELASWLDDWLARFDLTRDDIEHWGVHPGGPRILSAVEKSLGLSAESLATSRTVLREYGNMSSPTVLFILNQFMSQDSASTGVGRRYALLLAFGPGLVAEVALLRRG